MGYQRGEPGLPFAESVDKALAEMAAEMTAKGHRLAEVEFDMIVTGRDDHEVDIIRACAARIGFEAVVFVDDRIPPRPGTVPSSGLDPIASSATAEAHAARILGDK
jgi:hypothetical protein